MDVCVACVNIPHVYARAFESKAARAKGVPILLEKQAKMAPLSSYMVYEFKDEIPLEERVKAMKPILNALIRDWTRGEIKEGTRAFQADLVIRLRKAGLLKEKVKYHVKNVGVHPHNRNKTGLVPIDVQTLLDRIVNDGWDWAMVDCLACEIPPNNMGQEWIEFNLKLANQSKGQLPKHLAHQIEIVTVRGSHTTAVVRCIEYGAKGIHQALCDSDGRYSKATICEMKPSMREPCDDGIPYDVVPWQLVLEVPELMAVLSRTGNVSHGVHRVQTTLQAAKRIHEFYTEMIDDGRFTQDKRVSGGAPSRGGDGRPARVA